MSGKTSVSTGQAKGANSGVGVEGRHLWARGYCVSTVGLDEEKIRKYVQWQEKQEKQADAVHGKLFD